MLLSILVFIGVLSFLVFVHELGHFLAAKACGVYVDQFSVGMPPRVFGFKWGDTDYCVGALPIGGYVKMAGQEDAPLSEEEREDTYGHVPEDQWFNKKPFWKKFIILFAGPFMNLVIAVVLYAVIAAVGMDVSEAELSTRIGKVAEESPAAAAPLYLERSGAAFSEYTGEPDAMGWLPGDVVVALDGKPLDNFKDLAISAALSEPDVVRYALIERTDAQDKMTRYVSPITPALMDPDEERLRYGVTPFASVLVKEVFEDSPADEAGLLAGDIIQRVNGAWVDRITFSDLTAKTKEGALMRLGVLREDAPCNIEVRPRTEGRFRGLGIVAGKEDGERPRVVFVTEEYKEKSGIQRKDVIAAMNGEPATVEELQQWAKEHQGESVKVTVERPSILFGWIQKAEELELELPADPVSAVGIVHTSIDLKRHFPARQWVPVAFHESGKALALMGEIIGGLISGNVSTKQLGGPLMIGSVATQAFQMGWMRLLEITAFISINLCVMNLLPLPVLDGGQIVLNGLEAVRRKPLNQKFQEYFQFVGILMVVGLMLYVTGNDVVRWFEGLRP